MEIKPKPGTVDFMIAEYKDFYENVMHLETKLFNHLSYYTTLLLGIVTASVAILKLFEDQGTPLSTGLLWLFAPFLVFAIIGAYELRMTTELRVRKMKFVEGITQIRQFFVDYDKPVESYLMLPVGIKKAPPYLRVGSHDWYQMLYMVFMNGLGAAAATVCPLPYILERIGKMFPSWISSPLVLTVALAWSALVCLVWLYFCPFSYKVVMDFCASYDKRREATTGQKSEYDLLQRPLPRHCVFWTLGDWVYWLHTQRQRRDVH
jgi:hypothetical protein